MDEGRGGLALLFDRHAADELADHVRSGNVPRPAGFPAAAGGAEHRRPDRGARPGGQRTSQRRSPGSSSGEPVTSVRLRVARVTAT